MSRISALTSAARSPFRVDIPNTVIRANAEGSTVGEGLAAGASVATEALVDFTRRQIEAEEASQAAEVRAEIMRDVDSAADDALKQDNPSSSEPFFMGRVGQIREKLAKIENGNVRDFADRFLTDFATRQEIRTVRPGVARRVTDRASAALLDLQDTMAAGIAAGTLTSDEAVDQMDLQAEQYRGSVFNDEQVTAMRRGSKQRFLDTEIAALTTRDPEAAIAMLESDEVNSLLTPDDIRRRMSRAVSARDILRDRVSQQKFETAVDDVRSILSRDGGMIADGQFETTMDQHVESLMEADIVVDGGLDTERLANENDLRRLVLGPELEITVEQANRDPGGAREKFDMIVGQMGSDTESRDLIESQRSKLDRQIKEQSSINAASESIISRVNSGIPYSPGTAPQSQEAIDRSFREHMARGGDRSGYAKFAAESRMPMPRGLLASLNNDLSRANLDMGSYLETMTEVGDVDWNRALNLANDLDAPFIAKAAVVAARDFPPGTAGYDDFVEVLNSEAVYQASDAVLDALFPEEGNGINQSSAMDVPAGIVTRAVARRFESGMLIETTRAMQSGTLESAVDMQSTANFVGHNLKKRIGVVSIGGEKYVVPKQTYGLPAESGGSAGPGIFAGTPAGTFLALRGSDNGRDNFQDGMTSALAEYRDERNLDLVTRPDNGFRIDDKAYVPITFETGAPYAFVEWDVNDQRVTRTIDESTPRLLNSLAATYDQRVDRDSMTADAPLEFRPGMSQNEQREVVHRIRDLVQAEWADLSSIPPNFDDPDQRNLYVTRWRNRMIRLGWEPALFMPFNETTPTPLR